MSGHMILLNLLGGVALLLWGTNMVRTGVLGSFGPELRKALAAATQDRVRAAGAGLAAAAALQSATAVAMLLAGFVGRGLIGLAPALAMLLGADLGTTLVVQRWPSTSRRSRRSCCSPGSRRRSARAGTGCARSG